MNPFRGCTWLGLGLAKLGVFHHGSGRPFQIIKVKLQRESWELHQKMDVWTCVSSHLDSEGDAPSRSSGRRHGGSWLFLAVAGEYILYIVLGCFFQAGMELKKCWASAVKILWFKLSLARIEVRLQISKIIMQWHQALAVAIDLGGTP